MESYSNIPDRTYHDILQSTYNRHRECAQISSCITYNQWEQWERNGQRGSNFAKFLQERTSNILIGPQDGVTSGEYLSSSI